LNFFPDRFCASICTPVGLCVSVQRVRRGGGSAVSRFLSRFLAEGKRRKTSENEEIESR